MLDGSAGEASDHGACEEDRNIDWFYIFVPPINQQRYLWFNPDTVGQPQPSLDTGNQYYIRLYDSFQPVRFMLTIGIQNATMSMYFAERNNQ